MAYQRNYLPVGIEPAINFVLLQHSLTIRPVSDLLPRALHQIAGSTLPIRPRPTLCIPLHPIKYTRCRAPHHNPTPITGRSSHRIQFIHFRPLANHGLLVPAFNGWSYD